MRNTHLVGASVIALLAACSTAGPNPSQSPVPGDSTFSTRTDSIRRDSIGGNMRATVSMKSSSGRDLGSLNITEVAQALSISGTLRGLAPGSHGIHLHMVGRCDAPTFDTAGEHWNPTSKQHGTDNRQGPHLGDLNNITVGADSSASILVVTRGGSLRGTNMVIDSDGATLVIHSAADDQRTDPSGNSGARIACGVIGGSR